jgi:hypothetical protein
MLINQCLSGLAQQQIDKCNLVVFNHNESGLSFWRSNDWNQRTDLVVMQMTLG